MFEHKKQLLHEVKVERPNPQYAVLMQEQLGGGNGELKAAMQYISQSFRIKDPEIKDLFLDIGAEELSHMEMDMMLIIMKFVMEKFKLMYNVDYHQYLLTHQVHLGLLIMLLLLVI